MQWVIFELSQRPEMQQAIREEVERVIGKDKEPTYDDTKNLPFMRCVLNESMRLHPPVSAVLKTVDEPVEMSSGLTVPENTRVVIDIFSTFEYFLE